MSSIIQQPTALSFTGNMLPVIVTSSEAVAFTLKKGEDTLIEQVFMPGDDSRVEVDLSKVIASALIYTVNESAASYNNTTIYGTFTVTVDATSFSFVAIRGGVRRLATSVSSFVAENFLTWQPQDKKVRLNSPEYLTAYLLTTQRVRLKATFPNLTTTTITLATGVAGTWTFNLTYAKVTALLSGVYPAFYDVWIETIATSVRTSYIQRYTYSESKSAHEHWFLFQNSLGGLDTLLATGVHSFVGDNDYTIGENNETLSEVAVTAERLYTKNTGPLDTFERQWLLDFFPSAGKYLCDGSALLPIVMTESDVNYSAIDLPSAYQFTYRLSDDKPLLNLPRVANLPTGLSIVIPSGESFQIPPRLSELPRIEVGEGVMLPALGAYADQYGMVTVGSLLSWLSAQLGTSPTAGGGGVGHAHNNFDLLQLLTQIDGYLKINGVKVNAGMADDFTASGPAAAKILRKDIPDTAEGLIRFAKGLIAYGHEDGIFEGDEESIFEFPTEPETPAATTLGGLTNVSDEADTAEDGSVLVKTGGTWSAQPLTTPATTLGGLTNVSDEADTSEDGGMLILVNGVWVTKAGWIEVETEAERDTKTNLRNGTQCYVAETDSIFVYTNGIWGNFGSGTGSGTVVRLRSLFLTYSCAYKHSSLLRYTFTSVDSDKVSTGNGTAVYVVNGVKVATVVIPQGDNTYDIGEYMVKGANTATVTVTDTEGTVKTLSYVINAINIELTSTFDGSLVYDSVVTYRYTPIGDIEKTVHFVLDGAEIGTTVMLATNKQYTFVVPQQAHGSHQFRVYISANVDGVDIFSNELYYDLICIVAGNTTPIISVPFNTSSAPQFSGLTIPFSVYSPSSERSNVSLTANGVVLNTLSVDRSRQIWNYKIKYMDDLVLTVACGAITKTLNVSVVESAITSVAETLDLSLYLSSNGRTNSETHPEVWAYQGISAQLTNFNFTTNGWIVDKNQCDILRVSGDARVFIPLNIFANDFSLSGKTIEFEFASGNVEDYNAPLISCMNSNRGLLITPMKAAFYSEQSHIERMFKENERVRISFVIEKKGENRLIYIYINGIMSGTVRYPVGDNFMQSIPVGISFGSSMCVIDLYNIRVYDNNLKMNQVLDNYIYDMDDFDLKNRLFESNQIFDSYGEIVYSKVLDRIPCMTITGSLPTYKGDKKTVSLLYENKQDLTKAFTATGCSIDVQGTSSQYYPRKNFKIKFSKTVPIKLTFSGATSLKYALRDNSIPANCFCTKADFAESSGVHNTGMAKIIDATLKGMNYLIPPQKLDPRVRTTVDGFPIVIFHKATPDSPVTFLGKYNFNNDKSTMDTFGLGGVNECWEFLNNTSDRVLFKGADFDTMVDDGTGTGVLVADWTNDFEARYPDDDALNDSYKSGEKKPTDFAKLVAWVASTNRDAATNEALATPVVYGSVTYTHDTAVYRIAKFKSECSHHFNMNFLFFYYLNTELFAMTDQRGKNVFAATWNEIGAGGDLIWYFIFYDNDTCLGINNEGMIAHDYKVEYHDTIGSKYVWNANNSTLWNNVETCFPSEIEDMYKSIRSAGLLSYASMIDTFNKSQSDKWSESIYNADGTFKYIYPMIYGYLNSSNQIELVDTFLYALQGSRAEHRKWWLYNRFLYIDSKYSGGDYQGDYITMRLYTPPTWGGVAPNPDFTITPYADQYTRVKFGSYIIGQRSQRNVPILIDAPDIVFSDTETIIYGASRITSIGSLADKYAGTIDLSKATKLTEVLIGSGEVGYQNTNLEHFSVGANDMLKKLDIRNCPNLTQTVELKGCPNIKEIYAQGTAITSVSLPKGGYLEIMHLPDTISNLTIKSHPLLASGVEGFTIAGLSRLTTLVVENSNGVDPIGILKQCLALPTVILENVRFVGIDYTDTNINTLLALSFLKGKDENDNVIPVAYLSGTFHTASISKTTFDSLRAIFPFLFFDCDIVTNYTFLDNQVKAKIVSQFDINLDNEICTAFYDNEGNVINISEFDSVTNIPANMFLNDHAVSNFTDLTRFSNLVAYGDYAFSGSSFASIAIPDRVTSLGYACFKDCVSLTNVTLGIGITSIPALAFSGCTGITKISIPATVTSIGANAFNGCTNIKSVSCHAATPPTIAANTFPTPLVVYVPAAYVNTYKAAAVWSGFTIYAIPEGDAAIILTFTDAEVKRVLVSLYDIDGDGELMKWEAALITSIPANTFKNNTVLSTLSDLSKLLNLTSIGSYAFQNCTSITSADIPATVTSIGNSAFAGCNALTQFVVASGNTAFKTVTGVLYNFAITELVAYPNGKTSTEFTLPNTITLIRDYAFKGTNKLVIINTKTTTPATATVNSFDSVSKTTCKITVLNSSCIAGYQAATGWGLFSTIEVLVLSATINVATAGTLSSLVDATGIGRYTVMTLVLTGSLNGTDIACLRDMCDNGNLINIDLSGANIVAGGSAYYLNYNTSNNVLGEKMFYGLSKLVDLSIPSSVTSIGNNIFDGCTALSNIWVKQENYATYMDNASLSAYRAKFNCYIVFAEPTKSAKIKMYALMGKAAGATLTAREASTVTALNNYMFSDDSNLGSFDEFQFFTGITSTLGEAFKGSSLTSITLPYSLRTIGTNMFYSCGQLTSIKGIPEGVTDISNRFCQYCKLTELKLPNSLTRIGNYTFENNLFKTLTIPLNVRNIGTDSLSRVSAIKALIVKAWNGSSGAAYPGGFTSFGDYTNMKVYVPAAALSWYKSNGAWSGFASHIFAIGDVSLPTAGDLIYHIGDDLLTMSSLKVTGNINGDDLLVIRNMAINGILSNLDLSAANIVSGGAAYYGTDTTTANVIGNNMFRNCTKLSVVKFGTNIITVGSQVFSGCTLLSISGSLTFQATVPPTLTAQLFQDTAFNGSIYVPSASLDAYNTATNWAANANRIFAIPT